MIFVSNCPALPTNGSPCSSSSAPGASPTNINGESMLPDAKHHVLARRRQVRALDARHRPRPQFRKRRRLARIRARNFGWRMSADSLFPSPASPSRSRRRKEADWRGAGFHIRHPPQRRQVFRRYRHKPHSLFFQRFQMVNRGVKQSCIVVRHGGIVNHCAITARKSCSQALDQVNCFEAPYFRLASGAGNG